MVFGIASFTVGNLGLVSGSTLRGVVGAGFTLANGTISISYNQGPPNEGATLGLRVGSGTGFPINLAGPNYNSYTFTTEKINFPNYSSISYATIGVTAQKDGSVSSSSQTITFKNYLYWGSDTNTNETDINNWDSLSKSLVGNEAYAYDGVSIQFPGTNPLTDYGYFAIPSRLGGTVKYTYGETTNVPETLSAVNITNANGYMETYVVYRTQNQVGNITITLRNII